MAAYKREYSSKETRKAVWSYQFQVGGKTYKRSGFLTRGAAENAEKAKKKALRKSSARSKRVEQLSVPLHGACLREFVPQYLDHRMTTRAESTVKIETRRIRQAVEQFGDKLLEDIAAADIHNYVSRRKKKDGLANRTINLELNTLRCLFRYAEELEIIESNPASKVKNLPEPLNVEHWIPTPAQLQQFSDEAAKTAAGQVLVTWVWFMAYTGARPSEALFVEWPDIDFRQNRILIRPKPGSPLKGGRSRYIEMHPAIKDRLLSWQKHWTRVFERRAERHPDESSPPHQWVFFNPRRQLMRSRSFLASFRTARKKSGLPHMTPYTLRHFFISYCVMNEIPMLTIARWVGHTTTQMIEQVYGHLTPTYRAKQMTRFDITVADDEADQE